jgi:site-specific DNA-methyltransferase (adenine-specific)
MRNFALKLLTIDDNIFYNIGHMNKFIIGNTFDILQSLPDKSIDLIFLDVLEFISPYDWKMKKYDKETRTLISRWKSDFNNIGIYFSWLKEQIYEMKRLLKDTGSLYFFCNRHYKYNGKICLNHYIKTNVLDKVFGSNNFRNEIIFQSDNDPIFEDHKKYYHSNHDVIYFYSKSDTYTFNYEASETKDVIIKKNMVTQNKHKLNEEYILLLEKLIHISSNANDVFFDPFLNNSYSIITANRLKRKWIGITFTENDVESIESYLEEEDARNRTYKVINYEYNYTEIRYKEAFNFEKWIIKKFGGIPNNKQRYDKGIDGKTLDGIPIQVKRQDSISRDHIDRFNASIRRFNKQLINDKKIIGYFIAFSFGKGAINEVERLFKEEEIIIKLVNVDEIIKIKK